MGGLTEYLRSIQSEPFSWSGHNCMSFVSGALRVMGRDGLPDEWCSGYDNTRRAVVAYKRCLATYGYPDIIAAMDKKELSGRSYLRYESRFQYPLVAALVLLLVELALGERRWRGSGDEHGS